MIDRTILKFVPRSDKSEIVEYYLPYSVCLYMQYFNSVGDKERAELCRKALTRTEHDRCPITKDFKEAIADVQIATVLSQTIYKLN